MKNYFLGIISMVYMLTTTGCEKHIIESKRGELSAMVDGQSFTNGITRGQHTPGSIDIVSQKADGKSISLFFPHDISVGTYQLDRNLKYIATYVQSSTLMYFSESGTLTITKHDMKNSIVAGHFSFEASSDPPGHKNVIVSDGTFNVSY